MADDKKKAAAEDEPEEEVVPVGTTVEGGAYKVGGVMVDSDGKEIGKKDKADKK